MITRTYSTELDKDSFFSKLEKYWPFSWVKTPIKGSLKNGKGILEYGGRATKKFSIEFIAEIKHVGHKRERFNQ